MQDCGRTGIACKLEIAHILHVLRRIMHSKYSDNVLCPHELLTVEGQIIIFLSVKSRMAGEIYEFVKSSQSTISRKIARMVDQGKLDCRLSSSDRRVPIYSISASYRRYLSENQILSSLDIALPVIES